MSCNPYNMVPCDFLFIQRNMYLAYNIKNRIQIYNKEKHDETFYFFNIMLSVVMRRCVSVLQTALAIEK